MLLANGDDDKDRVFTAAVFSIRNIIIIIVEVVTALCSLKGPLNTDFDRF